MGVCAEQTGTHPCRSLLLKEERAPGGEWGPWEAFIYTRWAEPLAGSCRICEVGGII